MANLSQAKEHLRLADEEIKKAVALLDEDLPRLQIERDCSDDLCYMIGIIIKSLNKWEN